MARHGRRANEQGGRPGAGWRESERARFFPLPSLATTSPKWRNEGGGGRLGAGKAAASGAIVTPCGVGGRLNSSESSRSRAGGVVS